MAQSIGEALASFSVLTARIVLYLPLFALRVSARLGLLAATVAPVAIPFLAGYALLISWQEWDIGTQIGNWLERDHALVTGLAYFVAVGLFASFLKTIVNMFWAAVRGLLAPLRDVFRAGWVPSAEVRESLAVTLRDNFGKIPKNLMLTAWRATQVTAAVVVGTIAVAATTQFVLRDTKVDRYIWVATAKPEGKAPQADAEQSRTNAEQSQTDAEQEADSPQANGKPEPGTRQVLEAHMRNGTVFSLVHLHDADPQSGDGICLDESQQAWLREFRNAIAECVKAEGDRSGAKAPRFDVTAFASVAPVKSSGVTSAELNCEIANRRADAVGAFLANETEHQRKWDCDSVGEDFQAVKKLCAPSASDNRGFEDYPGFHDDAKFHARVHRWRNPGEMKRRKPADDGALPDDRRYAAEWFNRSVHITAPRGFCRPTESEQSESRAAAQPKETSNAPE